MRHAVTMLALGAVVAFPFGLILGCRREPAAAVGPPTAPSVPTVRLYVVSTAAGALDPCGCTKDQLGGIDHAAQFILAEAKRAPHALVVGAGPLLFQNPKTDDVHRVQDLWKAEALAASLGEMGLVAWAPGENDWTEGPAELARLSQSAHANVLAANLRGQTAGATATRVINVNGYRVGLAGVSEPRGPLGSPEGVEVGDARAALADALAALKKQGAQIFVALVAAERGRALRLAEEIPGFNIFVLGKPSDQGDGNDAPFPPALIEGTLVVQAPNHLQGVVVVDLFVRGPLDFKDGTGIRERELRQSLEARIAELGDRIRESETHGAAPGDIAARKMDVERLRKELAKVVDPALPSEGSFFRYDEQKVRKELGSSASVSSRMADYYARVNDHNREAFKDRLPATARAGDATYIGAEACSTCHEEAYDFWRHTAHASAYETLSKQHKEFNLDCVSCHVTGYEKPGGSTVTHVKGLENVECEVCHGPGSLHEKDPANVGTLVRSPPQTLCAPACHHPPHVKEGWSVADAWKVILGKGHGRK